MGNCLDHLQQINRNSRENCLADKYLQPIGVTCVEQECRSLLKEKSFRQAGILLKNLSFSDLSKGTLEKHLSGFIQGMFHIHKQMKMQVGTISKAIFAKTLIESQYLASLGQSMEHYE